MFVLSGRMCQTKQIIVFFIKQKRRLDMRICKEYKEAKRNGQASNICILLMHRYKPLILCNIELIGT